MVGNLAKVLSLSVVAVAIAVAGGVATEHDCWTEEHDYNVVVDGPLWIYAQACFNDPRQS